MPRLSVIIPAYNVEGYIEQAIASALGQPDTDLEVLVLDDCSSDGTAQVVERLAAQDSRVRLVRHDVNAGVHAMRMDGIRNALGERALFLDGDDELAPDTLAVLMDRFDRAGTDILHFGWQVIAEGPITTDEARAMEQTGNTQVEPLSGDALLHAVFDTDGGHVLDWRMTQRLFSTKVLKAAADTMDDARLEQGEDAYEFFAVIAPGVSHASADDVRAYVYHYGRGNTTQDVSLDRFSALCVRFSTTNAAVTRLADAYLDAASVAARGFVARHNEILSDFWDRVPRADQPAAITNWARLSGSATPSCQLWRRVGDLAYASWDQDTPLPDELDRLKDLATKLDETPDEDEDACALRNRVRFDSLWHLNDVVYRQAAREFGDTSATVFVTGHKRVNRPADKVFQPVQVGPGLVSDRFADTLHDDEGDNISQLNSSYCELTVQYWAWKNVKSDYYGFCHYRRYFNLSHVVYGENPWGEIMDSAIDAGAESRYALSHDGVAAVLNGYDIVTTGTHDVAEFPEHFSSMRDHWKGAPHLHNGDITLLEQVIADLEPDYVDDTTAFFEGTKAFFCNMFIMRAELFDRYCSWLFPLLEEWCNRADMTLYDKEALRTPGHLAERLLNIWINHERRLNPQLKVREVQCVHFTRPDHILPLEPLELPAASPAPVPVIFAADNGYVAQLATAILSTIDNADASRPLDLIVLHRDINPTNQAKIQRMVSTYPQAHLRFFDVSDSLAGYNLSTNNEHISVETYYRFLAQDVLPFYDKVLYLDCDMVILDDVCELFDTELGDNYLAASHDVDYLGNLNMHDGIRLRYTTETLQMSNPYDYFQAGVLVLNTAQLRKLHSVQEWMDVAQSANFIYDDQDILNRECEGHVVFLDPSWNVMTDTYNRVAGVFSFAPCAYFDAYNAAHTHPRIVHYAGGIKPWTTPDSDLADRWWNYGSRTPWFIPLLHNMALEERRYVDEVAANITNSSINRVNSLGDQVNGRVDAVELKIAHMGIRGAVGLVAPVGSSRRDALKDLAKTMMGKK